MATFKVLPIKRRKNLQEGLNPTNSVISRQLVVKDGLEALFLMFFRSISLNDLHKISCIFLGLGGNETKTSH